MKFKYHTGGYKPGTKKMIDNCTIRALSIMFDTDYLITQKSLQKISKDVFRKELDFSSGTPAPVTEYWMRSNGFRFLSVRDIQGIPLLRLISEDVPEFDCFPVMQSHITAIKNRINYDKTNRSGKLIYGIYLSDKMLPYIFTKWEGLRRVWDDVHVMPAAEGLKYYKENGFKKPSSKHKNSQK